jgi:dihydrodipicolinate synthase/N-acetylneuraminate lyase
LEHLVAQLPLPLFLYNMPALTKVQYEAGVLRWALEQPRVIGLKDSSGNMSYFREAISLAKSRPDWSVLVGPEELLVEGLAAGGHGGVPGGANIFPKLYVELCEAARAGDAQRAGQLHKEVMLISRSLYQIGRHRSAVIKGIKCALACMGVCDDFMAEPFHRFRATERGLVQGRLPELRAGVELLVSNHHPAEFTANTPQGRPVVRA